MASPLEYLTANSFIVYPFKDESSLTDTTFTFTFSDDVFLDLLFVSKLKTGVKAYLSDFSQDGTNFTLIFQLLNNSNTVIATATVIQPIVGVIEQQTFAYSDLNTAIKVVPGRGFVALGSLPSFSYSFLQPATEISSDAFRSFVPLVKSIAFYNQATLVANVTTDDLILQEGTNIQFIQEPGLSGILVAPGLGTGLFNPCAPEPGAIRSLNFVYSNGGRFFFATDGCYTKTLILNGLSLENECGPRCSPEDFENFGHYFNRVKNGLFTVSSYIDTTGDAVAAEMSTFLTTQIPVRTTPSFIAKQVKTSNATKKFYSFAVGLQNPSGANIFASISASGSGWTLIPNTAKISLDGVTTDLASISVVSYLVPCAHAALLTFVVSVPIASSASLTLTSNLSPFSQLFTL